MAIIYYPTQPIPGGSDQSVQFNLQGAFGGDNSLTYDYNSLTLSVGGPALFKAATSFLANVLDGTGSTGTNGQVLSSTGSATKWITASGGGTTPGGSDTSIQYNASGAFDGDSNLTWDYTNQVLSVGSQTAQFFFAGVLDGLWSFGVDDTVGGNSVVGIVDPSLSAAALQCLSSGSSAQIRAIGSVPAVVLTDGTSTFTAEATTYEISDGTDFITSVINNSTPAATTQFETSNASLELGASGTGAFLTLGAASGPTFEIACNEYGEYALGTGAFKFLNALYLGAALYDSTASAGSAGAILNSTGSAVVWTSVPTLSTLVLTGAPPTVSAGQLGLGSTTGLGNGSSGTAVTTTTQGTGSGPVTPQTVAGYIEANVGGTTVWLPYFE